MKKYTPLMIVALALFSLFACNKRDKINDIWNTAPIKGYQVKPINGGAIISYNVPDDPDLLYIMAEYELHGKIFTEKSSVYGNSLTLNGFDTTGKVTVKLFKVNNKGQKSEPTIVEFTPLESIVKIAQNSLKMQPDFAGITASWDNPSNTPLGIRLMYKRVDSLRGDTILTTQTVYFSTLGHETHTFRGFDHQRITFAIAFDDQWGNVSDTTYYTTTPFFETLIPKPYADVRREIPWDNITDLSSFYSFSNIWNNIVNTSHEGWLSSPGHSGVSITIDLKQRVKLSRVVIWGYNHNTPFDQVNIQKFELWGTDTIYQSRLADRNYWLDEYSVRNDEIFGISNAFVLPDTTFKDVWQYLGFYAITRYDLMTPPDQQAILNLSQNGMEYDMPINAKPVRYLRLYVREVGNQMPPPGNNYFSMGEISVYGDNTVSQIAGH